MIQATIIGGEQLEERLRVLPDKVMLAVTKRVQAAALQVEADVKANKLSGQVLHVKTGNLRRSIHTNPVNINGSNISATVGTNSEYAAIHEYGGVTSPHEIVPRNHEALKFMVDGKVLIRKRVMHPGSRIPERSFLRSTLKEDAEMIYEQIRLGVREGLQA